MDKFWIINNFFSFLLSALCAGVVIPQILLVAFRKKLFDQPDERKIHHLKVPRLGGLAFLPAVLFSLALLLGLNEFMGNGRFLEVLRGQAQLIAFLSCAMMALYVVGVADDLIGVRYRAKFFVQIMSAVMLILGGIWIDDLHGVLGIGELPLWIAYPFTVLVVVFITNAINLIDGLDGLASGLSSCAFLLYGYAFFVFKEYLYAMVAFSILGVLVPFFYYNVFGNPDRKHKIFMGDTGSLTIGMMLSFLSIKLLLHTPTEVDGTPNPLLLAYAPLLIPAFDVVRVYFYRVYHRRNPFLPDKNHIHHRLLAIGMNPSWAMITIIISALILTAANILLSLYININIILVLDILLWVGLHYWLAYKIKTTASQD